MLLLLTCLFSCHAQQAREGVLNVGAAEFHQKLNAGSGVLIDVRTLGEFNAGHIHGARLMNFHDSSFKEQLAALNRTDTVFVYCRSGNRSLIAVDMMAGMGFTHIVHLERGMNGWVKEGFPVEK